MASTSWARSPFLRVADAAADWWHVHRIPVLLATFAGLVALRIYLHLAEPRGARDGLLVLPKVYGAGGDTGAPSEKSGDAAKGRAAAAAPKSGSVDEEADTKAGPFPPSPPTAPKTAGPRRIKGGRNGARARPDAATTAAAAAPPARIQPIVFYSSLTGATAKLAADWAARLGASLEAAAARELPADRRGVFAAAPVLDLAEIDMDAYFVAPPTADQLAADAQQLVHPGEAEATGAAAYFYLFFLPSYNIDSMNDTLLEHLRETHHDFRIDTAPLAPLLGYSVFGFGDREGWPTEDQGFCFQAAELDRWMAKLTGRKRAFPLGCGDTKTDAALRLAEWRDGVVDVLALLARTGSLGPGVPGSGDPAESDEGEEGGEGEEEEAEEGDEPKSSAAVDDVEDLGRILRASRDDDEAAAAAAGAGPSVLAVDFTTYDADRRPAPRRTAAAAARPAKPAKPAPAPAPKEMVARDSPTYKSLTKQGYAVVGSHSGVKICRWTKSALRGRGSCYKFSFYGIHSHQCMETTPSLSCSNKCVFCWRHGTNPVGTTWRWVVDAPEAVFAGVKAGHYQKIKQMRGVPGVRAERFAEAMRIRHCALSLVGEPIFYPHINAFLGLLHGEHISSFLVCNAQHPDQLAALHHVTQLYVSIDASNREALRKIDRPLHRDFWERFQRCLAILRAARFRQRTVFRLTLVKGFNMDDEVRGYADLVEQALPCFVEVKGVTFCGTSTSAGVGLTMANVPFYHEVCDFVVALDRELRARGLDYGLAAEHAHSCCVLLASARFRRDGRWHTLIDYDAFFRLLAEHGPQGDFGPEDYMGPPTPEWATWGRGGFDPRDQRVDRKGRPIGN